MKTLVITATALLLAGSVEAAFALPDYNAVGAIRRANAARAKRADATRRLQLQEERQQTEKLIQDLESGKPVSSSDVLRALRRAEEHGL